jgi:hypothetical protein
LSPPSWTMDRGGYDKLSALFSLVEEFCSMLVRRLSKLWGVSWKECFVSHSSVTEIFRNFASGHVERSHRWAKKERFLVMSVSGCQATPA